MLSIYASIAAAAQYTARSRIGDFTPLGLVMLYHCDSRTSTSRDPAVRPKKALYSELKQTYGGVGVAVSDDTQSLIKSTALIKTIRKDEGRTGPFTAQIGKEPKNYV